ncbi:hypothetical protein PDM28_18290 [Stenotrophomonas aracearum]|uniref:Uncharacterized protein n=1 Tax=Stenotrophomonas aracearum TaxID=3003272 RepID=A0ABY9YCJ6_9GAMM|nr:hypothetical protein [Stenotrophomonas sp. A5588]WNH48582.1 hypothetical protein PDM28_18290 [Stenotrophomonas sp. A5588]
MTATVSSATPVPIAFREEGSAGGADAIQALGMTVLLLAVVLVGLYAARRRGWLQRWLGAAVLAKPTAEQDLRLTGTLRLSPRTSVHRIQSGDGEYLVVESSAQVQMHRVETSHDKA